MRAMPEPTTPATEAAPGSPNQTAEQFGEVAAKGLAAYEKAGITDPAKLRPLQAAKLAGENANLLGIWAKNEYHPLPFSEAAVEAATVARLRLAP